MADKLSVIYQPNKRWPIRKGDHKFFVPLKKHDAKVYIFGSRAREQFSKFSDVDIFFVQSSHSLPVPLNILSRILVTLEESNFPYKVDLVNADELASSYRSRVDADKIEL